MVASFEIPVTGLPRKCAPFPNHKDNRHFHRFLGLVREMPSFSREHGLFGEYFHVKFQWVSGFPEHEGIAATAHQGNHYSAVVKLDCVSTHREEIR